MALIMLVILFKIKSVDMASISTKTVHHTKVFGSTTSIMDMENSKNLKVQYMRDNGLTE